MVYSFVKEPKISYRGHIMDMPELKPIVVTVKLDPIDGDLVKKYAAMLGYSTTGMVKHIIKEWATRH